MASPKSPNGAGRLSVYGTKDDLNAKDETAVLDFERPRFSHTKTPDLSAGSQNGRLTPNPPAVLGPFDWDDFEARYEKALMDADEQEREILKEAEGLAKVRCIVSFVFHLSVCDTKQTTRAVLSSMVFGRLSS
jgi:hypothetical protein